MSKEPIHALVALFDTETGAGATLKTLRDQAMTIGKIQHAAVLHADSAGKLHMSEIDDMGGRKGAVIGGVAGGIIGILGPVIVAPLAIGAVIGGLAAKVRDSGFHNNDLALLGAKIQPSHSVLVIAASDGDAAEQLLLACGATVVRSAIDGHLADALESASIEATENSGAEPLADQSGQ